MIEGRKHRCSDSVFVHLDLSVGGDKKQGGLERERRREAERWTTCSLKQLANDLQTLEKCSQWS